MERWRALLTFNGVALQLGLSGLKTLVRKEVVNHVRSCSPDAGHTNIMVIHNGLTLKEAWRQTPMFARRAEGIYIVWKGAVAWANEAAQNLAPDAESKWCPEVNGRDPDCRGGYRDLTYVRSHMCNGRLHMAFPIFSNTSREEALGALIWVSSGRNKLGVSIGEPQVRPLNYKEKK
jgi:hypothetical protein